jgi:preprotein translocase subunit SecG
MQMQWLLSLIHILTCLFLILVVLLQSGRGGGLGAGMQSASGQIFGGRGASQFLIRFTTGTAFVFFLTSLSLSYLSSHHHSVVQHLKTPETEEDDDVIEAPDTPDNGQASPADATAAPTPQHETSSEKE